MNPEILANKMVSRVEFMIIQYMPKPTCSTKERLWNEHVKEVKRLIAEKIIK